MAVKNAEHLISVAIADCDNLDIVLPEVERILKNEFTFFEIIVVQHSSLAIPDELIKEVLANIDNGRCLTVTQPITSEIAMQIAIEKSIGDFILFFDPTVDEIALIPELIEHASKGHDYVAVEYDSTKKNMFYTWAASVFYFFVFLLTGTKVPQYTSSFSCITRRFASCLIESECFFYIKLFAKQSGYSVYTLPTRQIPPSLTLKLLGQKFNVALDIISHSAVRLISFGALVSLACCLANFAYLFYVTIVYLVSPDVQAGWTTTSFLLASMFAAIFFVLFAIGLACSHILRQNVKKNFSTVVQEISSSDNIFDFYQLNVEGD